ncbi:MAG: hypothetical protein KKA07_06490 [Bacteroidetes bacterium]|nr:hypothetical protein [Bacteroidota bacterium]
MEENFTMFYVYDNFEMEEGGLISEDELSEIKTILNAVGWLEEEPGAAMIGNIMQYAREA